MTKAEPTVSTVPNSLQPQIYFEDVHLIVLSKPAGLLSQGEHKGDPNVVDWLRAYWGRPYVGLVHRLDRNTSGIMIVAKRTKSAQRLTESLQEGKIYRSYLGWVSGSLRQPVQWKHRLLKNPQTNLVQVVPHGGKEAVLTARPVKYHLWNTLPVTLVEFVLETGRSHQIRAQASYEGFPLLGDKKYRSPAHTFPRVALHSHRLEFPHPMSKEIMKFEDPLPKDLLI